MKRKIPALLLALLLVFSAALPAGAAGYRCAVRSWPPDCWKQFFCDRFGIGCGGAVCRHGDEVRSQKIMSVLFLLPIEHGNVSLDFLVPLCLFCQKHPKHTQPITRARRRIVRTV